MRTLMFAVVAAVACGSEQPPPAPDAAAPCGGACGAGTVCDGGRCIVVMADAGPDAVGADAAPDSLDAAGDSAADAPACPPGFAMCGGSACVDLRSTLAHCGACDAPCWPWGRCEGGRCTHADLDAGLCEAGRRDCNQALSDGCEVDITSSDMNCGACGRACALPRERCVAGACAAR